MTDVVRNVPRSIRDNPGAYRSLYAGRPVSSEGSDRWKPRSSTTSIAAIVFAGLGIVVFFATFVVVDRLTPYQLWKEIIDDHNTALAVLIGSFALGMSLIIAAAIH